MRAVTFASILAVGMAGVACSEKAPVEPESVEANVAAPETPQFNLRFPTSDTAATEASGEFNLRIPEGDPQGNSVRLPEGAVRENAFNDMPEIRTPDMQDEDAPEEDPDDAIIRLD